MACRLANHAARVGPKGSALVSFFSFTSPPKSPAGGLRPIPVSPREKRGRYFSRARPRWQQGPPSTVRVLVAFRNVFLI